MTIERLMAWENGELTLTGEVELFQALVNSGQAWSLQGMYGRHAARLIEAGLVTRPVRPEREPLVVAETNYAKRKYNQ